MSNSERILVVDEVSDTAEVLQAVLEPRGLTVNRVNRLDQSQAPSIESPPAVVVLDVESYDEASCRGWEGWRNVPQVIIGTIRPSAPAMHEASHPTTAERRYIQKPFQYADLVQAIEALIVHQPR